MLGDSQENLAFDTSQKSTVMQSIARWAVLPSRGCGSCRSRLGALLVMPPDGLPIYDQSTQGPGAFTANCHSDVTLVATHVHLLAPVIAGGVCDLALDLFSAKRFDVQASP
jgi:hypothetical protein